MNAIKQKQRRFCSEALLSLFVWEEWIAYSFASNFSYYGSNENWQNQIDNLLLHHIKFPKENKLSDFSVMWH